MKLSMASSETFSDIFVPMVAVHGGIVGVSTVVSCALHAFSRIRPSYENQRRVQSWVLFTHANAQGLAANLLASPLMNFFTKNPYLSNFVGLILDLGITSDVLLDYQARGIT